ncbi:hypothetical protein F5883DRAFT_114222 [Diaporthe sp. PMI_573]|nr:hypothetical protein F5883DRAFT_114222 [Diaporthaceae sp. PMI_573]
MRRRAGRGRVWPACLSTYPLIPYLPAYLSACLPCLSACPVYVTIPQTHSRFNTAHYYPIVIFVLHVRMRTCAAARVVTEVGTTGSGGLAADTEARGGRAYKGVFPAIKREADTFRLSYPI